MASSSSCRREELFRRGGAELSIVVEGDERFLMQRGDFVLSLIKHACSPLAAVVAIVGDLHWPVGKDSLVVKTKGHRYSFSLPAALTFALAFSSPHAAHLQQLDCLLRQYSTFMPLLAAGTVETVDAPSAFWTRFARNAEREGSTLHEMGPDTCGPVCEKDLERMSPRLAQKMQQARLMSAVEKLFTRSVERGAINTAIHVTMGEADASQARGEADAKWAVASVDAVAKVVEAIETAGKTLCQNTQIAMTDWLERSYGKEGGKRADEGLDVCGRLITSAWTLNKVGLGMLFRTIASIQSRRNTGSTSGGGGSASSTDVSSSSQSPSTSSSGSLYSISSRQPTSVALQHSLAADNASSTSQVEVSSSPTPLAADSVPRAHAGTATSSFLVDTTWAMHGNRTSNVEQGRIRRFPSPPRFCGTGLPPPHLRSAADATVSLAAAATPAGRALSSTMGAYGMQAHRQANPQGQTAVSNPPSSVSSQLTRPAPCPDHEQKLV